MSLVSVVLIATAMLLAGCGGSTHTSSIGAPVGTRLSVGAAADNPGFVACMRRYGMTVLSNGDLQAAKTVTPAQLNGAEKLCGFGVETGKERAAKAAEARSEEMFGKSVEHTRTFRRLVSKLAACLRQNGVDVHGSDASSLSRIDTRGPQVKAAASKCRSELLGTSSG